MKMILLPGYKELFGDSTLRYTELVKDLPSEVIISILITLNNELNAPLTEEENQKRLILLFAERFSAANVDKLNKAYSKYRTKSQGAYQNYVFGRRYLLEMILKELNNFRSFELHDTTGDDEFNVLLAYLITVDEVNEKDTELVSEASKFKNDEFFDYRMIWTPNITQIEFSENTNPVYELFKLFSFSKFSQTHLRNYLKEYLHSFGFQTIGQFIGSINQIVQTTLLFYDQKTLKKLSYIVPKEGIDKRHLVAQTVNTIIGQKKKIWLSELRKYPLFDNKRNGILVIDQDIFNKKSYKGPFFELFYNTTQKNDKTFNDYSNQISLGVLEQMCFQNILKSYPHSKHDIVHFDNGTDSAPDCYFRHNDSIMLIEFKGYLFPDDLSANPSFDNIKKYIDERFIANEKGKAKGVGQILQQLRILSSKKYSFDLKIENLVSKKKRIVYPVIIHNEFHFSMPGISEYLNTILENKLDDEIKASLEIMPLVLINLEVLFDFTFRDGNFMKLQELIDRYHKIVENRKEFYKKNRTIDSFMRSKTSFDEIYRTIFSPELKKTHKASHSRISINDLVGITQEELDEIL